MCNTLNLGGWTLRGSNTCGAAVHAPFQTDPGAHSASYKIGTGLFYGIEWTRRGVKHSLSSSAEAKERIELHLYFPSGPLWPVMINLTLTQHIKNVYAVLKWT
jgi:hypothetical protein